MVAWLDRLTNLASLVRTEVCSPESSHNFTKETTRLGPSGWNRGRGLSDVFDNAPSGGWIEIKLTETPDTDPCMQAPASWRNCDHASKVDVSSRHFERSDHSDLKATTSQRPLRISTSKRQHRQKEEGRASCLRPPARNRSNLGARHNRVGTFLLNVVSISAIALVTYVLLGMRRSQLQRYLGKRGLSHS